MSEIIFETKANTLMNLKDKLHLSIVSESYVFTVHDWLFNSNQHIKRIQDTFFNETIIIRSSAENEDSADQSMAGVYTSIPNINSKQAKQIYHAVHDVINSYESKNSGDISSFQIFVQAMVKDVCMSGVILTRDLERYGPYYVVNYDDTTANTNSVTSGFSGEIKTIKIYKNCNTALLSNRELKIIEAVKEIERVTERACLEIEFAMNSSYEVYVLQVRPLVVNKEEYSYSNHDEAIQNEINHMKLFLKEKRNNKTDLFGNDTVLSEMADWNPAEIIGNHPKPLSYSLYSYIVMKDNWREGRKILGYKDVSPHRLMVNLGGRPYVDVRVDFISYLPANIKGELANKFNDFFIDKLKAHPEFHDKVEFEIVISSLSFDFDIHAEELQNAGFKPEEIKEYEKGIRLLTNDLVLDKKNLVLQMESSMEKMKRRREELLKITPSINNIPYIIDQLLSCCNMNGTLSFCIAARRAFIAISFLYTLRQKGIISDQQYNEFLSVKTISSEFKNHLKLLNSGEFTIAEFLSQYGHLRPGTYDITSMTYAENAEVFLESIHKGIQQETSADFSYQFPKSIRDTIETLIKQLGFSFSVDEMLSFAKEAIRAREEVKYEFTKNLSLVLDLIKSYGEHLGIGREDIAFLDIENILKFANSNYHEGIPRYLSTIIRENKARYDITSRIVLPDLIFTEMDLEIIQMQKKKPTYITQKKQVAQCIVLDQLSPKYDGDLEGKIILIENADPGYEWLFVKGIAGLITKYGGIASHMSIRCAEFQLPAAIGCGDYLFSKIKSGSVILLDCLNHQIKEHHVN